MRQGNRLFWGIAALGIAAFASGCGSSGSDTLGGGTGSDPNVNNPGAGGTPTPGQSGQGGSSGGGQAQLDARKVDYGEALRTASLKLVGELPTLADIKALEAAADKKAFYEQAIDKMLADPRFGERMIQWWRDTLKTGGPAANGRPSFETAATFAAMVTVQDRPYTDLFTATSGTCPTYDANSKTFTAANCAGNAPTAGLLTDPGLMAQYAANMAFRRVRFIQETFVCSKFPTEFTQTPQQMGAGAYTSPWPFTSVTGGTGPNIRINFQDTSSVVCANCHTTMNHQAPLFAYFDDNGAYTPGQIQVKTPSQGNPTSRLEDWLPQGQQDFAWRMGKPVTSIPQLGQEIAKDPDVARCAVNRIWNWGMSRGDIVNDLATVPPVVTDPIVQQFTAGGYKLKSVIRAVFTAEDFVKF
jgi:hypothetical protein